MPFTWFVALRYLRDAKGQSALILAAVAVGVSVVVFLSALINGLEVSLLDKTLGSQAHVTLQVPREAARPLVEPTARMAIARNVQVSAQRLRSIDQWPAAITAAERVSGVVAASELVTGPGFALRGEAKSPILIKGIAPERFLAIVDVQKKTTAGRFDVAGGNVVIGSALASDLGVMVGDKIRVMTTEGTADTVTVTGIFTLGNRAIDQTRLLTSLRHAQSLFALPGGVTTIELKVADVYGAERVAVELRERTGLDVQSWMVKNADLLSALTAQSNSKSMIQFFVVVAVALGIASVLIVSVVQKSREIGILRAVGTSSRSVLQIFLVQGAVLGLVGSILGSIFGAALAKLFESLALDASGAPRVPVQLPPSLFLTASALAMGVGLLAAVIPARRAARLDPALAIRNG